MFNKKSAVFIILILLIIPLAYAGNYGVGIYNADDYGVGEVPVSTPATSAGGGGGSGEGAGEAKGTISQLECSKNSDCKGNQYCSKHKCYNYECRLDSDCKIEEGETCLDYKCIKLFDIKITDFESQVKLGTEFEFSYFLKGMANISGDVEVHFWIEKDDEVVTSGHDTIYLGNREEKTEKTKVYLPTTIDSGVYTFFIQLVYGNYKVNTHRTIEIVVDKEKETATILGKTDTIKSLMPYLLFTLIGLVVFILYYTFLSKRKKTKSLELSTEEPSFMAKHKKVFWILLMITLFASIAAYLFYARILGLEQLQSLWNNIISWFSDKAAPFMKNIWRNVLLYLSPANRYFYPVIASIIGLIIIITAVVIAKKKHLSKEIKSWHGVKRIKEERLKKIELRANKLENFREFVEKYKILLIIMGIIVVCSISIAILFYYGILSIGKFSAFFSNILPLIINAYTKSLNWIILNYSYLIIGMLIVALTLFSYLKRENIKKITSQAWNFIVEHKLLFLILSGLIILSAVIIYLFYSRIVTVEQLRGIFD